VGGNGGGGDESGAVTGVWKRRAWIVGARERGSGMRSRRWCEAGRWYLQGYLVAVTGFLACWRMRRPAAFLRPFFSFFFEAADGCSWISIDIFNETRRVLNCAPNCVIRAPRPAQAVSVNVRAICIPAGIITTWFSLLRDGDKAAARWSNRSCWFFLIDPRLDDEYVCYGVPILPVTCGW
jgi:hypothetical protein